MDLEPKNKGHMNFYEHCDLTKKYIYYTVLYFKWSYGGQIQPW